MGLFSGKNFKRAGIGFATFGASEGARALNRFGGSGGGSIDISQELAKLRATFARAESEATAGVSRDAGRLRSRTATNLAARGILRSPVSENSFQRVREAELAQLGQVRSQFGRASANAEANLLSQLLGIRFKQEQQAGQRKAALFGTAGSVAGSLILGSLLGPAGAAAGPAVTQAIGDTPIGSTASSNVTPVLSNFFNPPQSNIFQSQDPTGTNLVLKRLLEG